MVNFLPGAEVFAAAGVAAATGPFIIHLLNRRRYRLKEWAAMQFLLAAVQRNRRILHLRDLLLLLLRTACLLLFGLALARPYFSRTSTAIEPNQPVHAVLVIDNSLSMGHRKLDGSNLLDETRNKSKEFLDVLPEGSLISVLPLCGSPAGFSREAYRTKQDARDALDQIEIVDRSGSAAQAADLALEACKRHLDMPAKRVVFLGDQQLINWPAESLDAHMKELPEMQVVSIAPAEPENTWIADFALQDSIADLENKAIFVVTVRHAGPLARNDVEVTLAIDGTNVESKTISFEAAQPGEPYQSREVVFEYDFKLLNLSVEEGKTIFVAAQASIPRDRLPEDDARYLAVPVLSGLPVVFVDQYGPDENPQKDRYGDTWYLRHLLGTTSAGSALARRLAASRHVRPDQIDRKLLENARLVIVAGVNLSEETVLLLRDYVKQGGQLVIAAGTDFDPAAWNQTAWRQGEGILPLPLEPKPIGQTTEEATTVLQPFFLSLESMVQDAFHLADTPGENLKNLYREPVFFKAVVADTGESVLADLKETEIRRIEEERRFRLESTDWLKKWAELESQGKLSDKDKNERARVEERQAALWPSWISWKQPRLDADAELKAADLAERAQPRVLAGFDNAVPFLIERKIGAGKVLFVSSSSGKRSSWNTLPKTNAVLLFSRLLRGMIEETLPAGNPTTLESWMLPVADRNLIYTLVRPDGGKEALLPEALTADLYGIIVRPRTKRGIYKVAAQRADASAAAEITGERLFEIPFAINGPSQESEPALLDENGLKERMGGAHFRWVARDQPIRLESVQVSGQNLWKWLIASVFLCLLAEMLVVVWPMLAREHAP